MEGRGVCVGREGLVVVVVVAVVVHERIKDTYSLYV